MTSSGLARRWHWLRANPLGIRITRYGLGSAVAAVTSEVVFVATYGPRLLGTTGASIVAFWAGAIPNFVLNRSWAWGRRGRLNVRREVLLYGLSSVISLVAASLATGWVNHAAPQLTDSRALRIALVAGAYLSVYGVLFVAKFLLYELVVFVDRPPGRPTVRHQVDATTPAKRSP
jgi:putative flippase GtrA